ncbi:YybH family protein [Deminuibacter soli]|uniref:DUF4440 domain-containing protein n=1 Tax=Deminuibacter soli TaxID=2291815 RepID=A0A3E1NPW1_9BACT|nr:nuclear transport factor 2 family protein [Deminuibacter soli]RFM29950.1 DUF4440 domain-containing protein [Deminuibacter soli]
MRKYYCLLITLLLLNSAHAQSKDEQEIRGLLNIQTEAWNHGNIEAFMQTYWQSDSLLFVGKKGIQYGWTNTLNNYKKSYPDATAMGQLHFNILQVKRLSALYFFVVGEWHLQRTIGNLDGHYTLLLRKIKGHWLIVSDHSS